MSSQNCLNLRQSNILSHKPLKAQISPTQGSGRISNRHSHSVVVGLLKKHARLQLVSGNLVEFRCCLAQIVVAAAISHMAVVYHLFGADDATALRLHLAVLIHLILIDKISVFDVKILFCAYFGAQWERAVQCCPHFPLLNFVLKAVDKHLNRAVEQYVEQLLATLLRHIVRLRCFNRCRNRCHIGEMKLRVVEFLAFGSHCFRLVVVKNPHVGVEIVHHLRHVRQAEKKARNLAAVTVAVAVDWSEFSAESF